MKIKEVKSIIDSIFSESGYTIKNFNIQFQHPLDIEIKKNGNDLALSFAKSLPRVTWKRIIKLSARISGIVLGETGGIIQLKYLPDIKFSYDETSEQMFGQCYSFDDIEQDIYSQYSDDESRLLAKKCLQYGSEWATIAVQGCDFGSLGSSDKRKLKKDCKQFIVDNLKNDKEIQAGSVFVTFLFFYVVLPVILKFIIEKLFRKLF